MHMRKRAAALSVTALLAAAALFGTASPAHAYPTGCSWGWDSSIAWAHCTGGTGNYRVWVRITHPDRQADLRWDEYGTCVSPGQRSEYVRHWSYSNDIKGHILC
ncbi:hypothetical protein GCM10017600_65620 [Streptosporangium carneum]|uniref:Secreted protein n=1 Tax=Streptosporangium carneum TaxID=47481 RepID=A0A9W6MGE4_9ACTN|nr:hypothetical protein GCM10017600_65620 [Streptosporangium carneum]